MQTVLYKTLRHRTLPRLRRRYGDVIRLRLVPNGRVVLLSDLADIKQVFSGSVRVYHGGEGNDVVRPVMGDHSIMLTDEDEHRRARRVMMPAFTSAALEGYHHALTDLAAREAEAWPTDGVVASFSRMRGFTLEVMLQVVCGFTPGPRTDELRDLMRRFVEIAPLDILGLHSPLLQRFGRWRRNAESQRRLDELIYAEIADRRAATTPGPTVDVLSRLLAGAGEDLTDVELRDHLVSLLLAGQETSATALSWACYELSRDPELQDRALAAARRDDRGFLEDILRESLRLHPVVSEVSRTVTRDVEVGGHVVPAGQDVVVAISLVQTDPDLHGDPEVFRPDRFADEEVPVGSWLPFGGGARRCLGAGFAMLEGGILLRELLLRRRLAPGSERPETSTARHVILVPSRDGRVRVSPR